MKDLTYSEAVDKKRKELQLKINLLIFKKKIRHIKSNWFCIGWSCGVIVITIVYIIIDRVFDIVCE